MGGGLPESSGGEHDDGRGKKKIKSKVSLAIDCKGIGWYDERDIDTIRT